MTAFGYAALVCLLLSIYMVMAFAFDLPNKAIALIFAFSVLVVYSFSHLNIDWVFIGERVLIALAVAYTAYMALFFLFVICLLMGVLISITPHPRRWRLRYIRRQRDGDRIESWMIECVDPDVSGRMERSEWFRYGNRDEHGAYV